MPPGCEVLDFELEVAVVIGEAGYKLSVDEAFDHVAGFNHPQRLVGPRPAGREMRGPRTR
ncbi:fumarylacetoacetate hydrolase family protein [Rhodococcus sp. NPDC127530]|uniref:fumarylacetoacetate hydrolase family protein n=1 Tax=unclassified Rhodococcus (in: high G+C Gram-positive bacteria) TaxID=192944 RepID=UPI00363717E0